MPKPNSERPITPLQEEVWFDLLFLHASLTDRIDSALFEKRNVSFTQYEILRRLYDDESQSVCDLASQLVNISRTRASRVIQDLVDSGYLVRRADQNDGRVSKISFTAGGKRLARSAIFTYEHAVRRLFIEQLDEADIEAIARIWKKIDGSVEVSS